ncbi:unnamed protein product [Blepharisma stoltei]|uniref:Uncharacterized protein n=1 Tax=Blepharisma stoltei TaxID=1481888 RepID=A0AAU9K8U4_9CILI|nr:unnamed protein product [Blepharisma stoltei]
MLIIDPPWLFIYFSKTTFDIEKVPIVSISITVLNPFVDNLLKGAKKFPAALFTKISIFPSFPNTKSTAALICPKSLTSHWKISQIFPPFSSSAFAFLNLSKFLPKIAILAPCCIKYFAIPKPIPEPPPVIRATFPSNKFSL